MTKNEFLTDQRPLVLIVSLDPVTKAIMSSYHPSKALEGLMDDKKKKFPDKFHFHRYNEAGEILKEDDISHLKPDGFTG